MREKNTMTKPINTNYLGLYLAHRGFTIKDLKAESVLILCYDLFSDFLSENIEKTIFLLEDKEETDYIKSKVKELHEYLGSGIIKTSVSIQAMIDYASSHPEDQNMLHKARTIQPTYYFYNTLVNSFKTRIQHFFEKEEEMMYIPELIAFNIIGEMKEKGYNFKKFPFIEEYDFLPISKIYESTNSALKQQKNLPRFKKKTNLKELTLITKMQMISISMTEKIISTKYK